MYHVKCIISVQLNKETKGSFLCLFYFTQQILHLFTLIVCQVWCSAFIKNLLHITANIQRNPFYVVCLKLSLNTNQKNE